jgi:hypothetical protein
VKRRSAHDCAVLEHGSFDLQDDVWATTHGHCQRAAAVKPAFRRTMLLGSGGRSRTDALKGMTTWADELVISSAHTKTTQLEAPTLS